MAEICNKEFSSSLFTASKARKSMVTEISTLCFYSNDEPFGLVYDDACDAGFSIVSQKTGKRATFVKNGTARTEDNELISWRLVPTPATLERCPNLAGWSVTVFND